MYVVLKLFALVGYFQLVIFMQVPNVEQNTVHKTASIAGSSFLSFV